MAALPEKNMSCLFSEVCFCGNRCTERIYIHSSPVGVPCGNVSSGSRELGKTSQARVGWEELVSLFFGRLIYVDLQFLNKETWMSSLLFG